MRTRADLDSAFALLEGVADAHYDPTYRPRQNRRDTRSWLLTAASAIVALAVGVAIGLVTANGKSDGIRPGDFGHSAPDPMLLRQLRFALHLGTGERVVDMGASVDGAQFARIRGRYGDVDLEVDSPYGVSRWIAPQATQVDINGDPGFYADGFPLSFTLPAGQSAPSSPPTHDETHAVIWQIAPSVWAQVQAVPASPTGPQSVVPKADLLRLARGVDFARTTALRVPVRLTAMPTGYSISRCIVSLPNSADATEWNFQVDLTGGGRTVQVVVGGGPLARADRAGQRVQVAGHPAYWDSRGSTPTLRVAYTEHVTLYVALSYGMTLDDAIGFAKAVQVTAHPNDVQTWYNARTALP